MLALFLEIVGAGLVTVYVDRKWLQVVLAVAIGIASPIVSNMLTYLLWPGEFTAGETLVRIVGWMTWHPLIAIAALLILRRNAKNTKTEGTENP